MFPHKITRILLVQFALWTLIVVASMAAVTWQANKTAQQIARIQGNDVFRIVRAMRQWNARHGGVLVQEDAETPANPYLHLKERDPVTVSGRQLTTLNPSYMTRQLAGDIRRDAGILIHITSLKPINPNNAADTWEAEALRGFETGQTKEKSELITEGGGQTIARYIAPLMTAQSCLGCHAQQGYQLGDVRGGISVSFSAEPLLAAMRHEIGIHAGLHLFVWLLVSLALLAFAAERERRIQELECSNKMLAEDAKMVALGSMVAGVAHEVNTPLGVCVTAASLVDNTRRNISRQLADASLSREFLEAELGTLGEAAKILEQNLQRAAKLIKSFKQIAVDQNSAESRSVDVGHFLDEILTAYHNPLKKGGVTARVDCPEKLIATLDAGAFAQIITNLLQNTLLHGVEPGQPGQAQISVRDLGRQMELVFADDGKGMDSETAKRAFDPFFTTKRGQGGSGLGLNIVYNLVTQRFKGDITLDSAPGRGATFTMHLTKES